MMPATILLAFCLASDVPAKHIRDTALLNNAYMTLAQAKPAYKGYRAKAMGHIKKAIGLAGGKVGGTNKSPRISGDSDIKLRAAQDMLKQSRFGLSGDALEQVNHAIEEISNALNNRSASETNLGNTE